MKKQLLFKKVSLRMLAIFLISYLSITNLMSQTFTELVVPKYIGSKTAASANNARTAVAFCFQIDGLTASTAYDIKIGLGLISDLATSFGAGNIWNGTAFSGSTISSAFTTNASGSSGPVWVFFQPTGNGTRFGGGAVHNLRVGYVTAGGTIPAAPAFISTKTITSLDIATTELTAATTDDGAFISGTALPVSDGKYVLIYDNTAGTGDPLFAYQIRQSIPTAAAQSELPTAINDIYQQAGTSAVGSYPAVIPIGANNPNGVRRIEARNADNTVFASNTDDDGIWPGGANTTTVLRREVATFTSADAPLQPVDPNAAADLFFSEYIEGGSNNKALEIFNGTGADVDLSGYFVKQGNNGGAWGADGSSASLPLSGILAAGDVYVIANAQSIAGILDQADSTFLYNATLEGHTVTAFNGDDALGLFKGTVLIDVIGTQGIDPGTGWPVAGVANATVDHTCVRKASVKQGNTDWTVSAGTTVDDSEWIVNAKDFIDNLGSHTFGTPTDVTAPTFTANIGDGDINVPINTTIVLTFDEAIRNIDDSEIMDTNVAALLTLKETDATGADVPFNATIDAAKKEITITPTADLKNSQVYYAAIEPVEDAANNATEASSMTFTTIASSASTISNIGIVGKTPYYAGDTVAITWESANVTDVKIEVWFSLQSFWVKVFPSTPSDGFEGFIIPSFSPYSEDYKIRITNLADTTVSAESSRFTVIAVAPDLVTLRAQPLNSIVKYTGIATVTYAQTSRNQKYIQDATAAVLIDDPNPGFIGTYNVGEGITNIVGKILLYNQLIEFTPQAATGEHATGMVIVPEVRTLESLTPADQCKLVKIENFAFKTPTQYDPTGVFVKSKNYDIDGFDNTLMAYRTAFTGADYIGGMVPVGIISSVCLVGQFNAQMQITARSWSDMTVPVAADFSADQTFVLTGENVNFMDMSTNHPTSWEWIFEGGNPATSTEQNPVVTYSEKGSYAVTLKVTHPSGGTNTVTKTDYISTGVVGISTLQSAVSVYPNPTNGKLFITNPAKDTQEIVVFNSVGKQVNTFVSSDGIIPMDITVQAKGMYMVRITNNATKSVRFKKIILN